MGSGQLRQRSGGHYPAIHSCGSCCVEDVPARKEFIRNSANLFQRDAALVQKQHCLSPSFAANKKKQLQQNYDLLLKQTST